MQVAEESGHHHLLPLFSGRHNESFLLLQYNARPFIGKGRPLIRGIGYSAAFIKQRFKTGDIRIRHYLDPQLIKTAETAEELAAAPGTNLNRTP